MAENQATTRGPNFKDRTGERFGRLTAIECIGRKGAGKGLYWRCSCDCGNATEVLSSNLGTRVNSCGCLSREESSRRLKNAVETRTTHGQSQGGSPEYRAWKCMMTRCYNPRRAKYKRYGGRGIVVCDRWRQSFESFLADMGARPSPQHSLDRKDNNGNYTPDNCRWATQQEQARNRSNNRTLTLDGKTVSLIEWSAITGIPRRVISDRIDKLKWSVELALTTPVHKKFSPKRA